MNDVHVWNLSTQKKRLKPEQFVKKGLNSTNLGKQPYNAQQDSWWNSTSILKFEAIEKSL